MTGGPEGLVYSGTTNSSSQVSFTDVPASSDTYVAKAWNCSSTAREKHHEHRHGDVAGHRYSVVQPEIQQQHVPAVMRALTRRLREEDGLTLSELLVVLAIMGVIMAALVGVLSMSITQSSQIQEQSTLQTEVRAATDTMASEIRQAYTGDTSYPIETATSTTLQFLSPDRALPYHNRRVAYRLASGRSTGPRRRAPTPTAHPGQASRGRPTGRFPRASWIPRIRSVSNAAVFKYYDKSGALLTGTITPSSVYRVVITVTVATKAAATRQYTYSTSASLRWEP